MAFRFEAKTAFVTWSQVNKTWDDFLPHFIERLSGLPKTSQYVISQEKHADGGIHYHAYIIWDEKLRIRGCDFLDVAGNHPNIRTIGKTKQDRLRVYQYVIKHGDVKRSADFPEPEETASKPTWSQLKACTNREEWWDLVHEISARDYHLSRERLEYSCDAQFNNRAPQPYIEPEHYGFFDIPRQMEDWVQNELNSEVCVSIISYRLLAITNGSLTRAKFLQWLLNNRTWFVLYSVQEDRPKSLIIIGPSRTGKTAWARSLGRHIYWNGMFNLRSFDNEAKYAIFDDFEDWSRFYNYKQWLGAQKEFTVSDKYCKKQQIKWGKPCIVISNEHPGFKDQSWIDINCTTIYLNNKIY